ncbi:transposase [Nostoc sp. CHAB 5834]|nr:transposase [Nostoc sp. CHAB 5834]
MRSGVPHGHWKTTTFVAGLRLTGIAADVALRARRPDRPQRLRDLRRQGLLPELTAGDVVVMDKLSSHKRPRVREMIEAVGASLLYLPPYSPDFNQSRWPSQS